MKTTGMIFNGEMVRALLAGEKTQTRRLVKSRKDLNVGCLLSANEIAGEVNGGDYSNCLYGAPGDLIWVRETWAPSVHAQDSNSFENYPVVFAASDPKMLTIDGKWRPSIHMPRWASRLTLRITDVRVERLQDLTEADAMAEGITTQKPNSDYWRFRDDFARHEYSGLWDSIYGNWVDNPWVWVYEFEVIHQNVDAYLSQRKAA